MVIRNVRVVSLNSFVCLRTCKPLTSLNDYSCKSGFSVFLAWECGNVLPSFEFDSGRLTYFFMLYRDYRKIDTKMDIYTYKENNY